MVTGKAIATLVLFILSIITIIRPVKIPLGRKRYFPLDLLTTPIIIIAILWASQCLGATTIRHGIVGTDGIKPYNILILFFSLAYMAITLDVTGILKAAAYWVSNISGRSGTKLFIYFYLLITALSGFFGNDPMILSGTLFLVYYTDAAKLDNLPWLMSEFAAANTASMVLFVGNPTNVVICEGFGIENAAYTAWTFFPFAACSVTCLVALYAQYRATGKLMPVLPDTKKFRARKAINDLPGAIVGTILLGGALATALIVSFVNVDVWKITLPFAGAKFIFDITWDLYRVKTIGIEKLQERMEASLPEHNRGDSEPQNISLERSFQRTQMDLHSGTRGKGLRNDPEKLEVKDFSPDSSLETVARNVDENRHRSNAGHSRVGSDSNTLSPQSTGTQIGQYIIDKPINIPSTEKRWWEEIPRVPAIVSFTRDHLPTLYNAFPRLPFALVPFAFSQFILIEALSGQGWINIFARWLVIATNREMYPMVWVVGVMGVVLCNISGTSIGATILLTQVVRAADLPADSKRAAGIALAVASNIGAVSFVFSASLAGLLWKGIIDDQKPDNNITQRIFARWNIIPLFVMMGVGLAMVTLEMHIKYR